MITVSVRLSVWRAKGMATKDTRFCNTSGSVVPQKFKFCQECGAEIVRAIEPPRELVNPKMSDDSPTQAPVLPPGRILLGSDRWPEEGAWRHYLDLASGDCYDYARHKHARWVENEKIRFYHHMSLLFLATCFWLLIVGLADLFMHRMQLATNSYVGAALCKLLHVSAALLIAIQLAQPYACAAELYLDLTHKDMEPGEAKSAWEARNSRHDFLESRVETSVTYQGIDP